MSAASVSPACNILAESQNKRKRCPAESSNNNKRLQKSEATSIVSSTKPDERVRKLLREVENTRGELSSLASQGAEKKLRDHCTKLRQKVEASCDTAVQNMRKSTTALIAQINDYERSSLARSGERATCRDAISDQLRHSARLLDELKQQLEWPSSENSENQNADQNHEDELAAMVAKLTKLKSELEARKSELVECEFNNTHLSFAVNRELVRESATLGHIVSRTSAAPLREIVVPKTRRKTSSTFEYAFAMRNGRKLVAFYQLLNQRWEDEWVGTLVCHLDEKEGGRATVKHDVEPHISVESICHVADEHTDVLVWPSRFYLGVYDHRLELLRQAPIAGGEICMLAANSKFVFIAQWDFGKFALSVRRLDTLEHVAKIEPAPGPSLRRLFANNEHLFLVSQEKTVDVIELAVLAQNGHVPDNGWVMRKYETPEFHNWKCKF